MPAAPQDRSLVPLLCLTGAVVFWGTSFVAAKIALDTFQPMAVIWLRMAIASLVLAPFWPRIPRPRYERGDWKWLLLVAVLQPCLYYLFEGYAVRYTTSSQAGVVSALVPLLVTAGAWAFLKERLSSGAAVAIAVSLGGVALLSIGGTSQASAPNPVLGNGLELLAMVSAAGSMLAIKHLSTRYGPWLLTGLQSLVGTVFFLPLALATGGIRLANVGTGAWVSVAYLGVFVSLGAFGLYNTALTRLPASRASLSINLVPAVALVAGWLVRGEALSALQAVACALIVGAVVFAELSAEARPAVGDAAAEEAALEAATGGQGAETLRPAGASPRPAVDVEPRDGGGTAPENA